MTGLPDDADALVSRARAHGLPIGNILHGKLDVDGKVLPGWRQYVANMTAWWVRCAALSLLLTLGMCATDPDPLAPYRVVPYSWPTMAVVSGRFLA